MSKSRRKQQTTTPAEQFNQQSMTGGQSMPYGRDGLQGAVEHDGVSYRTREKDEDTPLGDTLKSVAGQAWNGVTDAFGLSGESDKDTDTKNAVTGGRG